MSLVNWFARNPVAANFLMLIIIAGGIWGLVTAKKYTFPPEPQNLLQISIAYPGASPSEIEQRLCIPIEEAIHELEDIRQINAHAKQGECTVIVEFDTKSEVTHFQAQVKAKIDTVKIFPKEIEKINIEQLRTGTPAVVVVVRGGNDPYLLQQQRDRLKSLLSQHPDIGKLTAWPQFPYEVSIEVTADTLHRFGLHFDEIATAIRQSSINLSAGELKKADGKLMLRSMNQAITLNDFASIAIRSDKQGAKLLLSDIAQIRMTVNEQDQWIKLDDQLAMEIFVMPKDQISTTVNAVHQIMDEFRAELPPGLELTAWDDWSKYYHQYMTMLQSNAISGFALVFLLLMITLEFRLALWVGCGILVSILGALWMMPILGISLNTYSISALILILGVLADDAIVVGENIYTHQQAGQTGVSGVLAAVGEVSTLVMLMVLTTIIAFFPGLFLPGLSGNLMYNVAMVIILALLFSMMEALLILPAHLSVNVSPKNNRNALFRFLENLQTKINDQLQQFIERVYLPLLSKLLSLRYLTASVFFVILILFVSLVLSGRVPSIIEAQISEYYLLAEIRNPPGTPFEEINRQVARLGQTAREIQAELDSELGLNSETTPKQSFQHIFSYAMDHTAFVNIEMSIDERIRSRIEEIKQRWQKKFGEAPPGATMSFQMFWPQNLGVPTTQASKPLEFKLLALDPAIQNQAGEILKAKLESYTSVHSVTGSMQSGKPELRLRLKPASALYGLTEQSLSEQIRHAIHGLEVQRFFLDRDEIRVMVRFPSEHSRSLDALYQLPIRLPNGDIVTFNDVAEAVYAPGFAEITRQNRERVQLISADVNQGKGNIETILSDVRKHVIPQLQSQFPELKIESGQARQKKEATLSALWGYGALALLGIYALLAIPLRSYSQPLLIMLAIPFGFVGGVIGHLLLQIPLTLESYIAFFAVGGIVINDSLILLAKVNTLIECNTPIHEALLQAGKTRFRAIFLTTATTVIGLFPLLMEKSPHAEKILPMVTSLSFGVLFCMFITLILVPVTFLILKGSSD